MRKTITIGQHEVELLGNAATAILYKQAFHDDLLKSITELSQDNSGALAMIEKVEKMAFVMNAQATKSMKELAGNLTDAAFIDWLAQFDEDDFQDAVTLTNILSVWNKNIKGTSVAKNA